MARLINTPPSASSLLSSLRDLGYTPETAIADILDNSISASARNIDIYFIANIDDPYVAIVDDGIGMTEDSLLDAMRHGSKNPRDVRSKKDLGRFGLGLKTASFSQCRQLIVISKSNGKMTGCEWDLDHVASLDSWSLQLLDENEILGVPFNDQIGDTGTVVVWKKIDRMTENMQGESVQVLMNEHHDKVRHHLSLVFHRFLDGSAPFFPSIKIKLNGDEIKGFDPFCRSNKATQRLEDEIVRIGDAEVRIQPYVLPHHSRLSMTEYDFYKDRSDFLSNQGAYVYRNGRLMAWGDWFRLVPKGESTKLARVQIDFPNILDEKWTIDIKKSRARPPHEVRERLRQIIGNITNRSVNVHRRRGERLFQDALAPMWERYIDQGKIQFSINGQHPLVDSLKRKLTLEDEGHLAILLDAISSSIPVEMIYSDYSTQPRDVNQTSLDEAQVNEKIKRFWKVLYGEGKGDVKSFIQILHSTKLFEAGYYLNEELITEALK